MNRPPATAAELALLVEGQLDGCSTAVVRGMNSIEDAAADEAAFIVNEKYAAQWINATTRVAIVAQNVPCDVGDRATRALIRVAHAELALAKALEAFAPAAEMPQLGVHATAVVDPSATIGPGARIGAHVVIERSARLGAQCVLHAGSFVGAEVIMGDHCVLHAHAVVRERCQLGHRVVINACTVIGSDGFGYRPAADGKSMVRIPHLGTVVLDDGVEIGANCCVDRAKFGATRVGAGTKIDNLCQIAHGCRIGRMTVIAGLTGLAGSVTVGDGVQIGGSCGIGDHLTIGNGARLAAKSALMNDVPEGATWGGMPAQDIRTELRVIAAIRKLPEWSRKFRRLSEDSGKAL